MSDQVVDPNQLSERDQQALAAVEGMIQNTPAPPPANEPPAPEPNTPPAGQEPIKPAPQPGAPPAPEPNTPPAGPIEVKSAFGSQKFGATPEAVLSSFADVQAYAKENGIELEDVNSFKTLISQVTDLQKKAEEVSTLESMVNTYKSQFGSLPPDVANIVDAAISGKEYKSIIQNIAAGASIDLSRDFSEHNTVNLVRQYVQPDMTQEQYDELSDANKQAMNTLAKVKYESDQLGWRQATADKANEKAEFDKKFGQSVNTAMSELQKAFPEMDAAALKAVQDKMQFGLKDSLFNPDNTYKPDAAVKIAMQEFGQDALKESYNTIGQLANQMQSRIQGQTYENLVKRGDVPDQQGRQVQDQTNVVSEAVEQSLKFLKAR